jgi:GABA permease
MRPKRVLIIANEAVADRPAGVPEIVRRQVLEADEVRLVAPALTTRLQSWTSDIDRARSAADERMRAIVGSIAQTGQEATTGAVGDERPLQAVEDALAAFPADALILAVHAPDIQNWRERRLAERVRSRFGIPVTEMLLDSDGRVVSVASDLASPDK